MSFRVKKPCKSGFYYDDIFIYWHCKNLKFGWYILLPNFGAEGLFTMVEGKFGEYLGNVPN